MSNSKDLSHITVPGLLRFKTVMMTWFRPLYKKLGDLESWVLKAELQDTSVQQPIYVTSLPRSGTTILSEILSQHPDTCHHSYADFPGVFTPYWKHWIRQRQLIKPAAKNERAHRDRILINEDSIDAFEEVLWMYFYPQLHQQGLSQRIKGGLSSEFKKYYTDHIKKHLLIKQQSRYLAKANYNSNRIRLLLQLFPDAKFLVPVRHPLNHIASLMKQHQLFLQAGQHNRQIDHQLAASGHFEFGALRELQVMDGSAEPEQILAQFKQGEELNAWAAYWRYFYQALWDLISHDDQVKQAVKFVRFEDLCQQSDACLEQVFQHAELASAGADQIKQDYRGVLSPPDYYALPFTPQQKNDIMSITQSVADLFGYDNNNHT